MLFEIQSNHSKNDPDYDICMFLPISILSSEMSIGDDVNILYILL